MADRGSGTSIRLSLLIDSLLQKTYHDLNVLSELLPRKSDVERKIEIVKFASKTRQQFISLLAVVKWAASAKRVDECQEIAQQLEQKSLLFVDTADQLFRLSRDLLPNAKLPNFAIPAAVDVLTTGTYSRLPTCIKEKIIPPDPITPEQTLKTLDKLNHLIQQRLVATTVPQPLQKLQVADGRVKFLVDGEFEATLTVITDDDSTPWRLLELKILVEDPDESDQKPLVHQKQLQFLHHLVQSRLFTDSDELLDMYNCLHAFCVSLQLEVLHAQSRRLVVQRWGEDVRVKDYEYGQSFSLEYWGQPSSQAKPSVSTDTACKLTICVEDANSLSGLRVKHTPALCSHMDSSDTQHAPTNIAVYHGRLSVEQLLNEALKSRCADQLLYLKERLDNTCPGLEITFLGLELCSLVIKWKPLYLEVHSLVVSVHHQTGQYQVKLAKDVIISDQQMKVDVQGLEAALNSDASQTPNQMLHQLRSVE
jgi:mediator of RNA polymerase II transcription subunit 14